MLVLLMEGIYKLRTWDGLRCHDIHTKFRKDWSTQSKVVTEGYTDIHTHRQQGALMNLLIFFLNKESRPKSKWFKISISQFFHRRWEWYYVSVHVYLSRCYATELMTARRATLYVAVLYSSSCRRSGVLMWFLVGEVLWPKYVRVLTICN
jgi:hypothetical protein